MKTISKLVLALSMFITLCVTAQQGINYKALIKDNLGNVVANQTIDVRFTVIADTGPTNVYVETHTGVVTDANGIVILNIGNGTTSDVFTDISWGSDIHALKVEIDIEQDASFVDMGTTQFMAVPYALSAANAASKIDELSDGKSDSDGTQDGSSIFLGVNAGLNDDGTDNSNIGIGFEALQFNTTGYRNTANGYFALHFNDDGFENTATGRSALYSNTLGSRNTANGSYALVFNTEGQNNVANGYQALHRNITGNNNTANGYQALLLNTTGGNNTANGFGALYSTTVGRLTATGYKSLYSNTTGQFNTATGYESLFTNVTGSSNTANGYQVLLFNDGGSNNTATGYRALFNTLGSGNVALGFSAGSNETGDNTLYIANSDTSNPLIYGEFDSQKLTLNGATTVNGTTTVNSVDDDEFTDALSGIKTHTGDSDASGVYGENIVSDDYGTGVHGRGGRTGVFGNVVTSGTTFQHAGVRGYVNDVGSGSTNYGVIGTTAGNNGINYGVYAGGDLGYTGDLISVSDQKLKTNIKKLRTSMATIMSLQPSTYNFKESYQKSMQISDKPQFGFMAHELQTVLPELVSENKYPCFNKEDEVISYLGINYIGLIPILTAGIQEQEKHIKTLEEKIDSQNQTIESLISRIEALEKH